MRKAPVNNAQEARKLLRGHRYGALSTLSKKFDGHPFGSITPYVTDHDGSLLILISTIAEHTKNIQHDPRVSLITHDQQAPNIQTQGRVTLLGDAALEPDREKSGERYLRYFPEAESYFEMHDFSFFRIKPIGIRYIGGFGRIHWAEMEHYLVPSYELMEHETSVIEHMNADHQAALRNYCQHYHQCGALEVTMLGIDIDGFDVRADERVIRFDFEAPVIDAQQARAVLVEMAKAAKK